MIRLRRSSALLFALLLTPSLRADEKPQSPWMVDRSLTVSPKGPPAPALQYRLLPLSIELKPGNAVPIYLRLNLEQNDAARKYQTEAPKRWNTMPVDQMPLDEARKFLKDHHYMLRQLELGARRRTADWDYTLDTTDPDPISLLLPDMQPMRNYAPMLILQVRVALAEGDFQAAAHHLETGLAMCRHIARGPSLIHRLVAIALVNQFAGTVADFVERPGAPNLYWALTTLPRPMIDLRAAGEWEYGMVEMQFPELGDLDRERTPEQWDALLRHIRTEAQTLARLGPEGEGGKRKLPDWFPKDAGPGDPAAKSPDLPAARKYVARAKNLSAERVEAMPPAQVLLLYFMGTYHEDRDDWYRGMYLPSPQCYPVFAAAQKRLHDAPVSEAHVLAHIFLAALPRVVEARDRLERHLAALRGVEALRMYAAAHDGRLPDKLGDVAEVPVPDDPGTGRPFEYSRDGDTATVAGRVPGDAPPHNGVRYRVTIRAK